MCNVVNVSAQFGDDEQNGELQKLKEKCGSQPLVQNPKSHPVSNGCSKPAGLSIAGEEDFTYCCDRHDACYASCGVPKDYCEKDFGRCMNNMCKTVFSANSQCKTAAGMYKMGVEVFGGSGYTGSQAQKCTCLEKGTTLREHYEEILHSRYESFNRELSDEEIDEKIQK